MSMPTREWGSTGRYLFNGKEQDPEVKGPGVQYDYGFRINDTRLGRFLSVDPLTGNYPMLTPYQYASNNPIWGVDLDGLELLKSNSSIYLLKYTGGYTFLNRIYDNFVVQEVYKNIPNVLRDPQTTGLKSTMGGPVTAFGRDWDVSKDGAYMYKTGRYYNMGPEFYDDEEDLDVTKHDNIVPPSTNTTTGLYSFKQTPLALDENEAAAGGISSIADAGQHAWGMIKNWSNQSIWYANAKEGGDRFAFYRATNLFDKYINSNQIGDKSLVNGQGRADLINFVTDGSLPMDKTPIDKLSRTDLEHNLRIMYTGVQLLYRDKERGYINGETKDNFRKLNDTYLKLGGKLNFSSLYNIKRPE